MSGERRATRRGVEPKDPRQRLADWRQLVILQPSATTTYSLPIVIIAVPLRLFGRTRDPFNATNIDTLSAEPRAAAPGHRDQTSAPAPVDKVDPARRGGRMGCRRIFRGAEQTGRLCVREGLKRAASPDQDAAANCDGDGIGSRDSGQAGADVESDWYTNRLTLSTTVGLLCTTI